MRSIINFIRYQRTIRAYVFLMLADMNNDIYTASIKAHSIPLSDYPKFYTIIKNSDRKAIIKEAKERGFKY